MGRNFYSVCHECKVKLFHFRGQEGDYMQRFQGVHSDHEKMTEIYNDYIEEPPESYAELDNPTPEPDVVRAKLSGSDLELVDRKPTRTHTKSAQLHPSKTNDGGRDGRD